jgi:hypothetical protein
MEVLVPTTLSGRQVDRYIRSQVEAKLAETGEWPVKVSTRGGFAHAPGVMRYGVSFKTGQPNTYEMD